MGRGGLPQGSHEEDWVLGLGVLGVGSVGMADPVGNMDALQIRVQLCLRAWRLEAEGGREGERGRGTRSKSFSAENLSCFMYECLVA